MIATSSAERRKLRRPAGPAGHRRTAALATFLLSIGSIVAVGSAATASPAPSTPGSPASPVPSATTVPAAGGTLAADQARADQLASDIRVQGALIEQLSEQVDAATIRQSEVTANLADARQRVGATSVALSSARRTLAVQALAAYTSGGQVELSPTVHAADTPDPGVVYSYGEIAAGSEHDAIDAYRQLRRQQAAEQDRLSAAAEEAGVASAQLQTDRDAARSAVAAERATLAGVRGQMATLLVAAQAAQAAATAALVEASLARQGQLPNAAASPPPVVVTTAPSHVTTTTIGPTSPSHPAATARPVPGPAATPTPSSAPPAPPPTTTTTSTPPTTTPPPPPRAVPGAQTAIAYAEAQLGKPYLFGGSGPDSFDCSGLVMRAWGATGVSFPHLAQSQYAMTARLSIGELQPGDLVFFGTASAVSHVGIYIGGGNMIDAPTTGQNVSVQNIYWSDLLGGGRVIT